LNCRLLALIIRAVPDANLQEALILDAVLLGKVLESKPMGPVSGSWNPDGEAIMPEQVRIHNFWFPRGIYRATLQEIAI
jgi:hypothetical protein